MKKPRINKHRYGWCIQFTQHVFFVADVNDWYFIPSIEFHRYAGVKHFVVFAFLCFKLSICKWRFW